MRIVKSILKCVGLIVVSLQIFCALAVGASPERYLVCVYLVFAAGFSISLPICICKCYKRIRYLEEIIGELESKRWL